MKLLTAFLKLVRWPNLFFIALTQWLFYKCVVHSLYINNPQTLIKVANNEMLFYFLMAASLFIAAAGYIINDYFDVQIDTINKPEKVVVDQIVKRRWAIMWHIVFSAIGILLSAYVSYKTNKLVILIANICCVLLLWFYSTKFKRKLLTGNIIIAALTAWVIIVVYFFAGATFIDYFGWNTIHYPYNIKQFYKLTILYAGFAFIVSLIREVIKDMEDMHGDAQFHCHTMPIEWGIPATKVFVAVWIVVCVASLLIVQLYVWQLGFWFIALYSIILAIIPLLLILKELYKSSTVVHYHRLSTYLKFVMLTGILSMIFFKFLG